MSKKTTRKPDPIAAAFVRARRELEQLGAAYRAHLDTERDLNTARRVVLDCDDCEPPVFGWWNTWTDYELGLKQLQAPGRPLSGERGYEHVAFLLIATDNLHDEWNGSRPCGTEPTPRAVAPWVRGAA